MGLGPGIRIGAYEILGALGAGGMGEVYRARDARLGREVAIKLLPADLVNDPERRSRFDREAQAISALNHPHIVTLYEAGTSEFGPYLVLEKIEGHSLREVLSAGLVPVRRLVALSAQIADGLAKAHAAGIVHRDLKPDNVMVTEDGFAKILDFGLARMMWPELDAAVVGEDTTLARDTASGLILGTLGYLSPEQAAGKPADYRADQFALGALLYEMATRERPFRRDTMAESLAATIREEPPPLRSRRGELPAPLCWIIERCLAKDPNDRYASTKDLARDLADVRDRLSDLSGSAPEGVQPVGAASSRHPRRIAWVLGAIGVAALAAGTYTLGRQMTTTAPLPTFRALTFRRGIITGAKFSPDGKTIYYSAAFGAEPSRVFVTRLDGAESEPLKLPPAVLLAVSRKGELAILLTTGRNTANSPGTLARVSPLGGTPRALVDGALDADWAPDGERLAVLRGDSSLEFPIDHKIAASAFMPRVSPRGDRLAWVDDEGVRIADAEGKGGISDRIWVFGLAWAPDGNEVWFTGSESGSGYDRALYALSLAGKRRLIARAPGALTVFDVAPDGRGALISTGAGWWSVVASHRGENQDQSLDLFGRTELVGLSADGKWLLLDERREVGRGMYLRSTDGVQTLRLGDESPIGLSPDGRSALVTSHADPSRLMLLPTAAGSAQVLPATPGLEPLSFPRAQWSPDGRRLFVGFKVRGQGDSSARVYLRDNDAPWRPVTPAGVGASRFAVAPDGRTLAVADTTGVVTLFPVSGSAAKRLEGERGVPLTWSSDGQWLFLAQGGEEQPPAKVYRREIRTGRVEPWRLVGPSDLSGVSAIGPPILLAADGAVCVYKYARVSNELYLVEGVR